MKFRRSQTYFSASALPINSGPYPLDSPEVLEVARTPTKKFVQFWTRGSASSPRTSLAPSCYWGLGVGAASKTGPWQSGGWRSSTDFGIPGDSWNSFGFPVLSAVLD